MVYTTNTFEGGYTKVFISSKRRDSIDDFENWLWCLSILRFPREWNILPFDRATGDFHISWLKNKTKRNWRHIITSMTDTKTVKMTRG